MQTALDVARSAGLHIRQKSARFWTCCPMHGEKTPSMCFFPDGKFHCFGCGAHGDAADLYAALHGVTLAEALRIVKAERFQTAPRAPTAADLRRKVETWKSWKWAQACAELHEAQAFISTHNDQTEDYWNAVDQMSRANDTLNLLESAAPAQLLKMCAEDQCQDTKTKLTNTPP